MSDPVTVELVTKDGTTLKATGNPEEIARLLAIAGFSTGENGAAQEGRKNVPEGQSATSDPLYGIAEKSPNGTGVVITATDLKAKTALDAARRLIYIAIYAYQKIVGKQDMPRGEIISLLENYGLYDGNVRGMISADKALVKDGLKTMRLALPAVSIAKQFLADIADEQKKGEWSLGSKRKKKSSKKDAKNKE